MNSISLVPILIVALLCTRCVHAATPIGNWQFDDGDFQIGAGDQAFDGWIDEVRLTDRVLAPAEFLYTVPLAGTVIGVQ